MNLIYKTVVLLIILMQPAFMFAQNKPDFVKEAGLSSAIYRGVEFQRYPFRYNGSPYAYSDDFQLGTVIYNDVEYNGVLLNLNAHRDELHIKIPLNGRVIELDRALVGNFSIGNRKYTSFIGSRAIEGISEGFYELLYVGKDMLVKQNTKKYNERLQSTHKGTYRYFYPKNKFFVVKDGVCIPVSAIKHFPKIYKSEKKAIKGFIKANRIRFIDMDDKDLIFMEIMNFIDKN